MKQLELPFSRSPETSSPTLEVKSGFHERENNGQEREEKDASALDGTPGSNSVKPEVHPATDKIVDYGEQIAGARKDLLKDLSKTLDNATMKSLVELPFSKAFKRPDLEKAYREGALREKDVRFAEAVIAATLSTDKPKAGAKNDRVRAYFGNKTAVELWAETAHAGVETLRALFNADAPGRDGIIRKRTESRTSGEQQAKERQRQLEQWNPGKTFNGTSYPLNNIAVFMEVLERLGYEPGSNVKLPITGIVPDSFYGSYELKHGNGKKNYYAAPKTFEEVVEAIVYFARVDNADPETEHPRRMFSFAGRDPVYKTEGYKVYEYASPRSLRYREHVFDTKEDAEKYIEERKRSNEGGRNAGFSSPQAIKLISGYGKRVAVFENPLTGERIDLPGFEYGSKDEAEAAFEDDYPRLNEAANKALAERKEAPGEKAGRKKELFRIINHYDKGKGNYIYGIVLEESLKSGNALDTLPFYLADGLHARKEAEDLLNRNRDKWEQSVNEMRERRQKFVYFDGESQSRIGEDYRESKSVTAEEFANTFGFRGVQFGNWTNQDDRQAALNNAYDAFMDLSRVTGISPKALSLGGELGIAFGSRGSGRANAHYELDNVVINLTKTRGAGSLAHEWWHALDNYFARRGDLPMGMATQTRNIRMRDEMREAYDRIASNVEKSGYHNRSKQMGAYWGSMPEETARLFGEWVVDELAKEGAYNHFLSRGIENAEDKYIEMNYAFHQAFNDSPMGIEEFRKKPQALYGFVYPTREELATLGKGMKNFFEVLQEKTDEGTGRKVLYHKGERVVIPSGEEVALRDALVERLRESGIEVVTDSEAGRRVLDWANRRGKRERTQAMLGNLTRAANTIRGWLKNGNRGKVFSIELPERTQRMVRKAMGRDFASHEITANGIAHALKNHGEKGKKLNERSIPIQEKDAELIPYIMTAPDYVRKGSTDMTGRESVRFYKDLSNGHVVVVEKEYKDSPNDMETINMWAELSSSNVSDARTKARPLNSTSQPANEYRKTNAGTVIISSDDAAKIRKDAEDAILADGKVREQRAAHGSGADYDRFDFSYMGTGQGAQLYGYGGYCSQLDGIAVGFAKNKGTSFFIGDKGRLARGKRQEGLVETAIRVINVSLNSDLYSGQGFDGIKQSLINMYSKKYVDITRQENEDNQRIARIIERMREEDFILQRSRYLYTLEIPDDNGSNYLHWEKPVPDGIDREKMWDFTLGAVLSKGEHDEIERKMLSNDIRDSIEDTKTGKDLYKAISLYIGEKEASLLLSDMGFTGISYPAEYLRGGRADGARNYVIFKESDMRITDKVKFFRTSKGVTYGFTLGGKIYLDPNVATADTPIHEYAHLWASALRQSNPEEWRNVVNLMQDTPAWKKVKHRYPELSTKDEIADEALAAYSGKRGAERLRQAMRKAGQEDCIGGKTSAMEAIGRVREALQRFWRAAAGFLHIRYTTAEEVADRMLSDLLEGVKPKEIAARSAEEHAIEEKAKANGTWMKAPNGKPTNLTERSLHKDGNRVERLPLDKDDCTITDMGKKKIADRRLFKDGVPGKQRQGFQHQAKRARRGMKL